MPVKTLSNRAMPAATFGSESLWDLPEGATSFTIEAGEHYRSSGSARYGAGYFELPQLPEGSHRVEVVDSGGDIVFDQNVTSGAMTKRVVGGELTISRDLSWDSLEVIEVFRSIIVPAGSELKIYEGVIVFLHAGVNIEVSGRLTILGKREKPVVFLCDDPFGSWGGIYLNGGTADISECLITGGGGDDSRVFGHSQSQPVIGGKNAVITARHLALVNNKGKAFGLENAEVTLTKSLIQRCDTGGEFAGCKVTIDGCWFLEMPNNDAIAVDDDNDALYFNSSRGADTSYVRNSYFVRGKDDAIDHNGALLVVSNCLIDGFDNEGLAGSNTRHVRVENCYIANCEQGIEAGYGSPQVEVNHCTIRLCDTGLRFGDWYNWGCNGKLTVRNTISIDNRLHNVWNHDVLTNAAVVGAIDLTYSIVNDTTYNSGVGCITGTPVLDEFGRLRTQPRQPGWHAGSDSLDIGRLQKWPPE